MNIDYYRNSIILTSEFLIKIQKGFQTLERKTTAGTDAIHLIVNSRCSKHLCPWGVRHL